MQFTVTERIKTSKEKNKVLEEMLEAFKRVSETATLQDDILILEGVAATFGSINRTDTTNVSMKEKDNGYLLSADVDYKPSTMFWVLLVLLLFSGALWLLPIGFYLWHKNLVKTEIEKVFKNIRDEFED